MVTASVDIPALKARHPLGDTVEAAGVRLRGGGRVRQGVCPFHDEAEGSFTVYGDSERFYCFGCGEGGDVLDFVRRMEDLTLPEAIARLDGSPGPAPGAANRPAGPRQPPEAAGLPPRDPNLLTAAARFYAGQLRLESEAQEYLASRGVGQAAAARLGLGYAPGSGLRQTLESLGFSEKRLRDSGLFMAQGAERFAGMVVVPDPVSSTGQAVSGGLVRWLVGRAIDPDRTPRFQALPGPKPVLGLGRRLGPAPPLSAVVGEGVFDWLAPYRLGTSPPVAALGTQGVERVASCPPGQRPRLPRLRRRRRGPRGDGAASVPARTQGRRSHPSPGRRRRGRACGPSTRTSRLPRPLDTGRPSPPASGSPPLPLTELARSAPCLRDLLPLFPSTLTHRRNYAQCTTGSARPRLPGEETAPAFRYRNTPLRRRQT